ncbi:MAG: class B sortase [Bacilli bacterium]|nr:class B sortase [Bacilli bacterium]
MEKRGLKNKYRIILISIFIIICLIVLIYSLINIIGWKKDVDANKSIVEEIKENITIDENDDSIKIDFKSLKEQNSETIAYIKVNGTNIDHVVVKGNDNSYYLKHNFNKEYNIAGWIFADYHNKFDETDKNIVIFGHNTKDGSMFGTLKNVLDKSWQQNKDNLEITLITEKGQYKYQVFSTYSITPEYYYINTIFNSDDEYSKFINKIKSRSNYDYNVEVDSSDKVLTLSSCIGDGKKRVVVHSKLIENK